MSTSQPRDADVDRLLRTVLKPAAGGPAGVCPDPEMLAALVEGRLSLEERTGLETHVVECARCQEALALIGAEAPVPRSEPERAGWFTWVTSPRLRWLVPITAAATVAVFFFATRPLIAPGDDAPASDAPVQMARVEPFPEPGPMETPANETMTAPAAGRGPAGTGTAAAIRAQTVSAAKGAAGGGAANEAASALPERPQAARDAAPKGETKDEARDRPAAAPPRGDAVGLDRRMAATETPAADQAMAPAPAAEVEARGKYAAGEKLAPGAVAQGAVPAPAGLAMSAAPSKAASAPKAAAATSYLADATGAGDAALPVVVAPGGSVRWKLGAGGGVWRSDDGGVAWREQRTAVGAVLRAGSAPSPDVCWVVGSGGTVLLTMDGETWQRRPFPLPVDLAAVRAADARSAVVVARDGRRFETRDGGLTWR